MWEELSREVGMLQLSRSEPVLLARVSWLDSPEIVGGIFVSISQMTKEQGADPWGGVMGSYSRHFNETRIYDAAEITSIIEAIKKDYIDYEANELWRAENLRTDVWYRADIRFDILPGYNRNMEWLWLGYAANTMAWLEEHGYVLGEHTGW
jgi:hypothetical protein